MGAITFGLGALAVAACVQLLLPYFARTRLPHHFGGAVHDDRFLPVAEAFK